ncbi:MAG: phosphoribosyltransferase family protein [Chloroflexi bacterium]|nr:phosphoribosyltransferase family protein [Chloroflexota bacterium]
MGKPKISKELVRQIQGMRPSRICFSTTHTTALKQYIDQKWLGSFSIPFTESIGEIFHKETGYALQKGNRENNFWISIQTEEVYAKIEQFVEKYGTRVFLRDTLDLSLALSEYLIGQDVRTKIGEWEYQAKYCGNLEAVDCLFKECITVIESTPCYSDGDCLICAVPASDPQIPSMNLPVTIANRISEKLSRQNMCEDIFWATTKEQVKDLSIEQKWDALESADLIVKCDLSGKKILLIDDMYQSGTTMQYVAMKLQEKGAESIYGLSLVKSRSNKGNLLNE